MGADIHPLAELCGVFSSWEERRDQEIQFSPSFHGNRQWEYWQMLSMASLRTKYLQEHNLLLDTGDFTWGTGLAVPLPWGELSSLQTLGDPVLVLASFLLPFSPGGKEGGWRR